MDRGTADLSLFIKCEVCGQNLTGQPRKFADGTRELRWVCFKHNKKAHAAGKARPPAMQDKVLKKMVAEVLDMEEFDAGAMCGRRHMPACPLTMKNSLQAMRRRWIITRAT